MNSNAARSAARLERRHGSKCTETHFADRAELHADVGVIHEPLPISLRELARRLPRLIGARVRHRRFEKLFEELERYLPGHRFTFLKNDEPDVCFSLRCKVERVDRVRHRLHAKVVTTRDIDLQKIEWSGRGHANRSSNLPPFHHGGSTPVFEAMIQPPVREGLSVVETHFASRCTTTQGQILRIDLPIGVACCEQRRMLRVGEVRMQTETKRKRFARAIFDRKGDLQRASAHRESLSRAIAVRRPADTSRKAHRQMVCSQAIHCPGTLPGGSMRRMRQAREVLR